MPSSSQPGTQGAGPVLGVRLATAWGQGPSLQCTGPVAGGLRQEGGLLSVRLCRGGHGLPHACRDKLLRRIQQPGSPQSPLPFPDPWVDRQARLAARGQRRGGAAGPGRADRSTPPAAPPRCRPWRTEDACLPRQRSRARRGGTHMPSSAERSGELSCPQRDESNSPVSSETGRSRQGAGLRASCCAVPLTRNIHTGKPSGTDTATAGCRRGPPAGAGGRGGGDRDGAAQAAPVGGQARNQGGSQYDPQCWVLEGALGSACVPPQVSCAGFGATHHTAARRAPGPRRGACSAAGRPPGPGSRAA